MPQEPGSLYESIETHGVWSAETLSQKLKCEPVETGSPRQSPRPH